jgi:hypothetical protein
VTLIIIIIIIIIIIMECNGDLYKAVSDNEMSDKEDEYDSEAEFMEEEEEESTEQEESSDDDGEEVEWNTFCPMCGSTENLYTHTSIPDCYGNAYVFCSGKKCYKDYRNHLMARMTNLMHGIPYFWTVDTPKRGKYCPVPSRQEGDEPLTCDYCGTKNEQVISHPRMPAKYNATSFCKNNTCCSSFMEYVDDPPIVPYALCKRTHDVSTNTDSNELSSDHANNVGSDHANNVGCKRIKKE